MSFFPFVKPSSVPLSDIRKGIPGLSLENPTGEMTVRETENPSVRVSGRGTPEAKMGKAF